VARRQSDPTSDELAAADEIGRRLEAWFDSHGRSFRWRRWRDAYRVAVTEILLQRTRAEVVDAFLPPFLERFPNWASLTRVSLPVLTQELAPLGLQSRRAASMKALAREMRAVDSPAWESLPAVGQYISRAIAVGTTGAALAMVDTNFVRVLTRVFIGSWMADYRYDRRLQELALAIVHGAKSSRTVNWAVLDLGATVCTPKGPRCGICPLMSLCETGRWHEAPREGVTPSIRLR
jgi:A/G-specific adenine glycosylase